DGEVVLEGTLDLPADLHGSIVFSHGGGSNRKSPRTDISRRCCSGPDSARCCSTCFAQQRTRLAHPLRHRPADPATHARRAAARSGDLILPWRLHDRALPQPPPAARRWARSTFTVA